MNRDYLTELFGRLQQGVDHNGMAAGDIQGLFGESPTPTDSNLARIEQRARRAVAIRRTAGTRRAVAAGEPAAAAPPPIRLPFRPPERDRG